MFKHICNLLWDLHVYVMRGSQWITRIILIFPTVMPRNILIDPGISTVFRTISSSFGSKWYRGKG